MLLSVWRELIRGSFFEDRWRMGRGGASARRADRRRLAMEPLEQRRLLAGGDLDPSFGDGGLVTTDFLDPDAVTRDIGYDVVAVQSDGKIVVAGYSNQGGSNGWDFAVTRYTPDGSLDAAFGTDGRVVTDFAGSRDFAFFVAVQPDGKVVVGGSTYQYGNSDFALVRYHSDGRLDTSFGGDGKVVTSFGPSDDRACDVEILQGGEILVAGWTRDGSFGVDFALARYHADGSLDPSFGAGGTTTTDFGSQSDKAWGMDLQEDGKLVVVGSSYRGSNNYDFAVARYHADGSLDDSFDGDGKVTTGIGPTNDFGIDVTAGADGRIVAAGYSHQAGGGSNFTLVRYLNDGSLDPELDTDGKVMTDFGASELARATSIQPDGKILVAGVSYAGAGASDFAVARYNNDGSLDAGFDGDGRVLTDFGYGRDSAYGMDLQSDGKIVVAGYADQGPTDYGIALARYNTDGSLDNAFGTGGKVTTDVTVSSENYAHDVAMASQSNGKIVVAGTIRGTVDDADFALARYNADGSLDTAFGSNGKVTTDFGSTSDHAWSVAVQTDGKIVVAGYSDQGDTDYDFALVRYHTDGSPDDTFGTGGKVTTDFGFSYDRAVAVAVDPDGKIVVAGYSDQEDTGHDFALARYNGDGSLDTTFGTDGLVTTDFGSATDDAWAVAVQADRKIVAAGFSGQDGTGHDFALARYNTDGSLDTAFDADGRVTTDFGSSRDYAYGIALQEDGKIVAVGFSDQGGTGDDFALARYNTDGSPDTAFDADGKVTTDFASPRDRAYGVAVQSDGKVVAAGYAYQGSTGADFALARYHTDGRLDTDFDTDGKVTTDFGSSLDRASGIALQSDGKIVAAGFSQQDGTGRDFALARYIGLVEDTAYLATDHYQEGTMLVAVGTSGDDRVLFSPGANAGQIVVKINGTTKGAFEPTGRLVAYGLGGNDTIQVAASIELAAWLYGGAGNDRLKGGAGHDVLDGEEGDDLLVGQSGRDILVGGLGGDRIVGNTDDDVLIAGCLTFGDTDQAICAIRREWLSDHDYQTRIENLSGVTRDGLNDGYFLILGETVENDSDDDKLTGSAGLDWFFFEEGRDRATDLNDEVFANDLDWITAP